MLKIWATVMGLLACTSALAQKKVDPVKVTFHGFAMKRPLPDHFKPPLPTGLEFDIRVEIQDKKRVLGVDVPNAKLQRFESQLKTNLAPEEAWIKRAMVSTDRRDFFLRIGTPILPKKGERYFWFEAIVPVYTGARLLSLDANNLDATKPVPYKQAGKKLEEVRVDRAGIYTRVELLLNMLSTQVAQVVFKDIDNTVLPSEQIEIKPGATAEQNWFVYKIKTDTTRLSISTSYYGEVLKQFVPIKVKVPLWF